MQLHTRTVAMPCFFHNPASRSDAVCCVTAGPLSGIAAHASRTHPKLSSNTADLLASGPNALAQLQRLHEPRAQS